MAELRQNFGKAWKRNISSRRLKDLGEEMQLALPQGLKDLAEQMSHQLSVYQLFLDTRHAGESHRHCSTQRIRYFLFLKVCMQPWNLTSSTLEYLKP